MRNRTRTTSCDGSMCTSDARSRLACVRIRVTTCTIGASSATTSVSSTLGRALARSPRPPRRPRRGCRRHRWRGSCCRWPTGCRTPGRGRSGSDARVDCASRARTLTEGWSDTATCRPSSSSRIGIAMFSPHDLLGDEARASGSGLSRRRSTTGMCSRSASTSISSRSFSAPMSTSVSPNRLPVPDSSWTISACATSSSETKPRRTSSAPNGSPRGVARPRRCVDLGRDRDRALSRHRCRSGLGGVARARPPLYGRVLSLRPSFIFPPLALRWCLREREDRRRSCTGWSATRRGGHCDEERLADGRERIGDGRDLVFETTWTAVAVCWFSGLTREPPLSCVIVTVAPLMNPVPSMVIDVPWVV